MRNEADRIAIENESMAKRIIQQYVKKAENKKKITKKKNPISPRKATIKNSELKKEVDKYLELRLHMQKFKDYYAEPPKK